MHWKRLLRNAIVGLVTGVTLSQIIALTVSYALRLGYYMPYPASLPEVVGGELNAVALIMAVCGLLGLGVGIALEFMKNHDIKPQHRVIAILFSLVVAIVPALMLILKIRS